MLGASLNAELAKDERRRKKSLCRPIIQPAAFDVRVLTTFFIPASFSAWKLLTGTDRATHEDFHNWDPKNNSLLFSES